MRRVARPWLRWRERAVWRKQGQQRGLHRGHGVRSGPKKRARMDEESVRQRLRQQHRTRGSERSKNLGLIMGAVVIAGIGMSYAAVPLYRMFCQLTGYGGTTQVVDSTALIQPVPEHVHLRPLKIRFNSDVSATLHWRFTPLQPDITLVPGETSLAFYRACNESDAPIVGVSTYNVTPSKVGIYFNKIQCFCFEEQRLAPHEEIDMPVFFYIDPDFLSDPDMDDVNEITLSYTFFRAKTTEDEVGLTVAELLDALPKDSSVHVPAHVVRDLKRQTGQLADEGQSRE